MRRVALLLCALLGATVLPFAPGNDSSVSAAPSDVVAVVVEGTGFGHGRGMSQWGAYGWAVDQGKSWQWILDHYYGGESGATTSGTVPGGSRIDVHLERYDGMTTLGVSTGDGPVTVGEHSMRSLFAKEVAPNSFEIWGSNAMACPNSWLMPVPTGTGSSAAVRQVQTFLNTFQPTGKSLAVDGQFGPITRARLVAWQIAVGLYSNGVWDGDDTAKASSLISASRFTRLTPAGSTVSGPIRFTTGNDGAVNAAGQGSADRFGVLRVCDVNGAISSYRGAIELHDVSAEGHQNRVVNDVRLEDYLRGVVPTEISASWADAGRPPGVTTGDGKGANAVRAQAVAARSYALAPEHDWRYASKGRYATICDSTKCQAYSGSAVEDDRTDRAIAATTNVVRRWPNGAVVYAEFSASNGPLTAGGRLGANPYVFPPVEDTPGDGTSLNPNHRWTRILDADTLAARYSLGRLTSATMVEAQSPVNQEYEGIWFNDVLLTGTTGSIRIPAWTFRGSHGLPSPGFTVRTVTRDTQPTSVAMIGDSVGNSIAGSSTSELRTLVDGTFASTRFDVVDGRCTTNTGCPGTSGVQAAAALPFGLDLVVVELGYNDSPSTFASAIDAMMAALQKQGVRQVAWVNMAENRTLYTTSNAALQAARTRWPNLTVLDWNAASAGPERPRWFVPNDGVHLTTTGQAEFALWVREAMVSAVDTRLAPPKRIEVQVTGRSVTGPDGKVTTIPNGVSAASFNVTAVTPIGSGFVTVWPCSVARPLASNLNYSRGSIDANGVIAPVDSNGKACLYSHVATDIVVDITGWFGPGTNGGSGFQAITPRRLVDSRDGTGVPVGRIRPEAPIRIQVTGAPAQTIDGAATTVPANAVAAAINVTSVSSPGSGYITVWPCGVDRPVVSTLNFSAGAIRANGAIAALGTGGTLCLYSHAPTDVVVDIVGWFTAGATPSTSAFVSPVPARWVDTREGLGAPKRPVAPAGPIEIPVTGRQMNVGGKLVTIPADAEAVSLNIVSVDAPRAGYATVWPCGTARPTTSNLNYPGRNVVANNVIATIGVGGSVCLYTHSDSHVVVDVTGWFTRGDAYSAAVPDRAVDTRFGIGPGPV